MDSNNYSLRDFFDQKKISDKTLEELYSKEGIGELKIRLNQECQELEWKAVWNSIIDHVDKLLNINVSEIMLRAWKNYHDLSKYRDLEKYPPDKSFLAPLLEHTITSKHKPEIVIELEPLFKKTIPFDINIKLVLKGFTLEIQAGKVIKIHTGECKGSGTFQCLNVTLLEKATGNIVLPGIIDLGEGVPIGPEKEKAA
jgi:hypothetical protein